MIIVLKSVASKNKGLILVNNVQYIQPQHRLKNSYYIKEIDGKLSCGGYKMVLKGKNIEFGLNTFGDVAYKDETGEIMNSRESLQNILKEGQLADQVGVNIFALGEHHRKEYSISSPEVMLGAIASVTKNIKLSTAVTVLSSDDPVRVYERFATLDGISNGRAQIMLGRGSFTESYPLFGFDLQNYDTLFEEKIELFDQLLKDDVINWEGTFTQSLKDVEMYPKIEGHDLPVYVGVGGTPESVIRTVRYGYGLMLAIIGGEPKRFAPYIELYRRAAEELDMPVHPVGMHSHGVIADTDEEAYEIGWKYIKQNMDKIGEDRGWPAMTKERYDFEVNKGSYYVGSVETVAQKIAKVIKELDLGRFDLVYGTGGQFEKDRLKTIELYGTKVIPRVREILDSGENNE